MASAPIPRASSWRATLSAPCLVRVKTMALETSGCTQQVFENVAFVQGVHHDHALVGLLDGHLPWRHIHAYGIPENFASERSNFFRHGGREQKRLPCPWRLRDDASHVANKSHVQQPVGFVQNQNGYLREIQATLSHKVQQAPRGCDYHVDASCQSPDLGVLTDAAEYACVHQPGVAPEDGELPMNLQGQLSCRREDQRPRLPRSRARRIFVQTLQQRQRKCRGLAGSRLGYAQKVLSTQQVGDAHELDGSGFRVTHIFQCAEKFPADLQGVEAIPVQ